MATKKDIYDRYLNEHLKADKIRKSEILDAVTDVTRMARKAAIRKFRRLQMKDSARPERRARPTVYGKNVTAALKTVWEAANGPCGELLHPMIDDLSVLRRDGMTTQRQRGYWP